MATPHTPLTTATLRLFLDLMLARLVGDMDDDARRTELIQRFADVQPEVDAMRDVRLRHEFLTGLLSTMPPSLLDHALRSVEDLEARSIADAHDVRAIVEAARRNDEHTRQVLAALWRAGLDEVSEHAIEDGPVESPTAGAHVDAGVELGDASDGSSDETVRMPVVGENAAGLCTEAMLLADVLGSMSADDVETVGTLLTEQEMDALDDASRACDRAAFDEHFGRFVASLRARGRDATVGLELAQVVGDQSMWAVWYLTSGYEARRGEDDGAGAATRVGIVGDSDATSDDGEAFTSFAKGLFDRLDAQFAALSAALDERFAALRGEVMAFIGKPH